MKIFFITLIACVLGAFVYGASKAPQKESGAEQTLSIIKPDAVAADHIGAIIDRFEKAGLHVVAAKMTKLTQKQAEDFYAVHKERPFFKDLVTYMVSGPIFVQVLEGDNAVAVNRKIMGATNPAKAEQGTIRADFGTDVQRNAAHGSDSVENAKTEISFFFKPDQIYSR
jgi:nucleoside-diphosphate kinase